MLAWTPLITFAIGAMLLAERLVMHFRPADLYRWQSQPGSVVLYVCLFLSAALMSLASWQETNTPLLLNILTAIGAFILLGLSIESAYAFKKLRVSETETLELKDKLKSTFLGVFVAFLVGATFAVLKFKVFV